MFKKHLMAIASLGLLIQLPAQAAPLDSIYTNLASAYCMTLNVDDDTGSSVQKCNGVAGYSLLVEEYDLHHSITVVSPNGRKSELDFTRVITFAPSALGEKAEWRVQKRGNQIVPIALIVRVYAYENPNAPNPRTSYLSVSKITPETICVTAKVRNAANANEEARRQAEVAAYQPCLR